MTERWVAVLGRRDAPTDAVEDYCRYLSAALTPRGIALETDRVEWSSLGWRVALADFLARRADQKNSWYFLQYTALAWSQRGFPWRFLSVLQRLKKTGARCAVVFHDVETYFGGRLVDRVRRKVQVRTMRQAARIADLSILTVPPEKIPWLAPDSRNVVFIPVGANLPEPEKAWSKPGKVAGGAPAVAVFSVSGGDGSERETQLIASTAKFVSERIGALRLAVLGRNSERAGELLREKLRGTTVDVAALGLLPADQMAAALGSCDALLFVRGPISSRRGSAIAGIACGLPVVAQSGYETAEPITLAGVALLPPEQEYEFGPTLLRVLSDGEYREGLAQRSRKAQAEYFSWQAIAEKYVRAVRENESKTDRHSK
jgi:glycosyltransferase involved in cell wall biosynthesis